MVSPANHYLPTQPKRVLSPERMTIFNNSTHNPHSRIVMSPNINST